MVMIVGAKFIRAHSIQNYNYFQFNLMAEVGALPKKRNMKLEVYR